MKTPVCCGEVVVSTAERKEFFYCRGCKSEVSNDAATKVSSEITAGVALSILEQVEFSITGLITSRKGFIQ